MMTKFRKINDDDNIKRLAHWIYATDVKLFNKLYTNKTNSLEAIQKLIMSNHINPYHRKFITLLYVNKPSDVKAMAISFKGNEITVTQTYKAFSDTGFLNFKSPVLFEYVSIIYSSYIKNNDYYLASLYVDRNYRNNYIGSKLVENIKQKARQSNSNNMLIDVDNDKASLINFYMKLGFEKSKLNYHTLIGNRNGYTTMIYKIK